MSICTPGPDRCGSAAVVRPVNSSKSIPIGPRSSAPTPADQSMSVAPRGAAAVQTGLSVVAEVAAAAGAARVWSMGWPFWARRRLRTWSPLNNGTILPSTHVMRPFGEDCGPQCEYAAAVLF